MSRSWFSALPLALVVGAVPAWAAPRSFADGAVDVAILYDGEWALEAAISEQLRAELTEAAGTTWTIRFPDTMVGRGDWTHDGVKKAFDALLADPKVDLVITTGPVGSDLAARSTPKKPVFAAFVLDPAVQGLPAAKKGTGVANLNYLGLPTSMATDLATLADLAPAGKVAVLVAAPLAASMDPKWRDRLTAAAPEGTTLQIVEVGPTAAGVVEGLGADVQSVYITPLPLLSPSERDVLAAGLRERRLPAFAAYGADWVDRGLLASRPSDAVLPALLRRLGLNVEAALYGDDVGGLPTVVDARPPLLINADTARAIGASPGWEVLSEARLVSGAPDETTRTALAEATREAIVANVDLAAAAQDVEAGAAQVGLARSPLLPTLALGAEARAIDPDLAAASFGMLPQYWGLATLELSQIIVDDEHFAGLASEKATQLGREATYSSQVSDAIVDAAGVYLDVLRARSTEGLERSNLEVTRKNLDLARVRERVGAASPAEVHRWEVEVTTDQRHLLDATAATRTAEFAFNRTLSRPLDEGVLLADSDIAATEILAQNERLLSRLEDPLNLDRLAVFLVADAVQRSPEIAAIEATIDAASKDLAQSKRSYFVPTIGVTGRASLRMFWGGQGKEGDGVTMPDDYVPPDAFSWLVGANARLPLIEGGARSAQTASLSAAVAQARLEREAAGERIEERVRSALILAAASWRSFALAEEGSTSAHLALDATTVSYSVGSASVLELLDAQDVTLESDTAYVDAGHAFHRDLVALMRSIDRFTFLQPEEDRTSFFDAMDSWMAGQ